MTVLNDAGGVITESGLQRTNRTPALVMGSLQQAVLLGEWLRGQAGRLQQQVVSKHTAHGKLVEIIPIYDKEVKVGGMI